MDDKFFKHLTGDDQINKIAERLEHRERNPTNSFKVLRKQDGGFYEVERKEDSTRVAMKDFNSKPTVNDISNFKR